MRSNLVILKNFFTEFKNTGMISPSSPWTAKALTSILREKNRHPLNILEAGAGTGAVSKYIFRYMIPGDRLTLCEINPNFCKTLRQKLPEMRNYSRFAKNVVVFEGPVQGLDRDNSFDVIICSIPFANFDCSLTAEIFKKFKEVASPQARLSYFGYFGVKEISEIIPAKKRRQRVRALQEFLKTQKYFPNVVGRKFCLDVIPTEVKILSV